MKKRLIINLSFLLTLLPGGSVFAAGTFGHGLFDPGTFASPTSLEDATAQAFRNHAPFFYTASIVMIIYAAFMLFLSAGDPGKVKKAKDILYYTFIAIGLIVAANIILNLMGANVIPI